MRPDYYVLDKETCPHMSLRLHTMSCIVVSIFKILETLAKNNLEHHLRKMNVTGYSSIMWVKFNGILIHPNFNYDLKQFSVLFPWRDKFWFGWLDWADGPWFVYWYVYYYYLLIKWQMGRWWAEQPTLLTNPLEQI